MDIADHASEREMADRELALAARRTRHSSGVSASHCRDCGEPIPLERRQALSGVTLCVDCQALQERYERSHA